MRRGRLSPDLAQHLAEAREARGITVAELARGFGVSERYIEMLEAGERRPSLTVSYYLVDQLELDREVGARLIAECGAGRGHDAEEAASV